jgi:hypothetical protein
MASNRTREPLRGAFIAILAAAIGAAGTLLGNQLASSNAREQVAVQLSHDDSVRQSESRQDAYANFIAGVSEYEIDLERVVLLSGDKPPSKTDLKELIGDVARLETLSSVVQVVGSAKAAGLAVGIRKALDKILNSALNGDLGPEEILSRANDIEPKLELFAKAARDELRR